MNKTLVSTVIATVLTANANQIGATEIDDEIATNEYEANVIGMGFGAASGVLIAGPIGGIVGGFLGSLYTYNDSNIETVKPIDSKTVVESDLDSALTELGNAEFDNAGLDNAELDNDVVINTTTLDQQQKVAVTHEDKQKIFASLDGSLLIDEANLESLQDIIANDLNMVVYFKRGSVNFETFYSAQFTTILNLLNSMPDMTLKLEAYSDRQGSSSDNLQLSEERLSSVRDYFIAMGIDDNRINSHAYGEKNFISNYGELESYVFDRRVVVSFTSEPSSKNNSLAVMIDTPAF